MLSTDTCFQYISKHSLLIFVPSFQKKSPDDLIAFLGSTENNVRMMINAAASKEQEGMKSIVRDWANKLAKGPMEYRKESTANVSAGNNEGQEYSSIQEKKSMSKQAQV